MPERFKVVYIMQGAIQVLRFTFLPFPHLSQKMCYYIPVCANFGDLYLQEAWVKYVQFSCAASKRLRKLCPCIILRVRLSVYVILTQHQRFSDVVLHCLPLPRHLSNVRYFLNFSSNLVMLVILCPTFVQKLS